MKKFLTLFMMCSLIFSGPVRAEDSPSILIIPFDNATGKNAFASLEKGMPDLITAFLSPYSDHVTIIERDIIEAVFSESSLSWEGFNQDDTYTKLGVLSQAQFIIRGNINLTGDELGVNVALHDTQTTVLVKSFEAVGFSDELPAIAQKIAIQVANYFKTDVKRISDLPTDEDPEKSLNMINALGFYHNGQVEEAITFFMKILEQYPEDETARYFLVKCFDSLGMNDHATLAFNEFNHIFPNSSKGDELREVLGILEENEETDEQ